MAAFGAVVAACIRVAAAVFLGSLGLPGCRCLGFRFSCRLPLCLTAFFLCGACGCFCLSRGFSFLLSRSLLRLVCCFGF